MTKHAYCIPVGVLVLVLLILFPPSFATAQSLPLAIGLAPLSNRSANQNLDVVALMAGSSIDLSLRLLGSFKLAPVSAADQAAARTAAERGGLAGVLFGSVEEAPDGSIKLSVALFDRLKDSLSHSQTETAATLLDVFEASDRLTEKLVEALAGRRVGFGALDLVLTPAGAAGLSVLLNDTLLSLAEGRLPPIPAGDYRLELRQKRFGREVSLLKQPMTVKENQRSRIELTIPDLTEDEQAYFEDFDREIMEMIPDKPKEASIRLNELAEVVGKDLSFDFAPFLVKKYRNWNVWLTKRDISSLTRNPREKTGYNSDQYALIDNILGNSKINLINLLKNRFSFIPAIEPLLPYARISIDGNADDWSRVSPVKMDTGEEQKKAEPSDDLVGLYFVRDEKVLFFRIDNAAKRWDREGNVRLHLILHATAGKVKTWTIIAKVRPPQAPILVAVEQRGNSVLEIPIWDSTASAGECLEMRIPAASLGDPWFVQFMSIDLRRPTPNTLRENAWPIVDDL